MKHIDRLRAIAVLFMVEVHTAAILPPQGVTVGHPAAFVAAAFGGMAAPMFVTISGWGMYGSAKRRVSEGYSGMDWIDWIFPRFVILFACQLMVNLLLNVERGGRFEWQTPGVLTLLAVASLIIPILSRMSMVQRTFAMAMFCFAPMFMGEISGSEMGWFERVDSEGISEWFSRLFWNGTYPLVPWIFFVLLGTLLYDLREDVLSRERGIALGLLATSITVIIAVLEKIDWALTSGDAILTFFPASMPFLVVSGTMVALIMRILEGEEVSGGNPRMGERLAFLEPAGRLSLTIYVSHFAILGVAAILMQGEPRLELFPAFAVTIFHTIIWIPLALIHERRIPGYSLEVLMKKLSRASSQ